MLETLPEVDGEEEAPCGGGITLTCCGARFGIRVDDPGLLDRITAHLPPGWRPARRPGGEPVYSLERQDGGVRLTAPALPGAEPPPAAAELLGLEAALRQLESLLHFHVAVTAPRLLFVHAGVVAWKDRA